MLSQHLFSKLRPNCNPFGGGSSHSATDDARVAATDNARVIQGGSSADEVKGTKIVVSGGSGQGSGVAKIGSTDVSASGSGAKTNVGGVQVSDAKGNVTIDTGGSAVPGITQTFADTVRDLVASISPRITTPPASASDISSAVASQTASDVGTGTAGMTSPETSSASNTAKWTTGLTVLAALLGIYYYFRKR